MPNHDHAGRCNQQLALLKALNTAQTRQQILEARADKGPNRALAASLPNDPHDDVLIQEDEILVDAVDETAAAQQLPGFSTRRVLGGRAVVFTPPPQTQLDVPGRVRSLRQNSIGASANHVVACGGTDKGGASPNPSGLSLPAGSTTNAGELVVVIDTGVDNAITGRADGWLDGVTGDTDPLGPSGSPQPLDLGGGHGTFVAGIVRQVARRSTVHVIRALETDGTATELTLAEAILAAADLFANAPRGRGILNLSLGFETLDGEPPVVVRLALDELFSRLPDAVLVAAAAGNAKTGTRVWPAAFDDVIAVGSHDGNGNPPTGSQWSNSGDWVDFSARGECVVSTFVAGKEMKGTPAVLYPNPRDTFTGNSPIAVWSGTSFSTPQISGALAELWDNNPNFGANAVRDQLTQSLPDSNDHGRMLDERLAVP